MITAPVRVAAREGRPAVVRSSFTVAPRAVEQPAEDPLLRTLLGSALRAERLSQHRTLRDVSTSARVSLGYLSEIERGQKEASSELLAAICASLELRLLDVLRAVLTQSRDEVAERGSVRVALGAAAEGQHRLARAATWPALRDSSATVVNRAA